MSEDRSPPFRASTAPSSVEKTIAPRGAGSGAIEEAEIADDTAAVPTRVRTTTRPAPVWKPSDKGAASVLIVEDNAPFRDLLVQGLGLSYVVYEADNGATALEMLAQMDPPACIISDVTMPRMGGIELLQAVRADTRLRHVPVLLLTAESAPASVVEAINAGARGYITKPFKLKALLEKVATLLAKGRLSEMPPGPLTM